MYYWIGYDKQGKEYGLERAHINAAKDEPIKWLLRHAQIQKEIIAEVPSVKNRKPWLRANRKELACTLIALSEKTGVQFR